MKTQKIKKRFVLLCVLAVLLALIIWTAWGNTALMVNTISVSSDRIPAGFSGYRIAQVSDLHNAEFGAGNTKLLGYNGLTFGVETGDDEALAFMNKGFRASDVLEQCRKLEAAGISYNFFYLTGISGAGRGEIGAKASAELFNQLHPQIIESSMLTIYKTSELYQEIQRGNWKEEGEIEKLAELKALIENLTIDTRIVTDGASNLIQVRGHLPADKEKLVGYLEHLIETADEAALREYRVNLRHL